MKKIIPLMILIISCISLVLVQGYNPDDDDPETGEGYDPSQEGFDWESNQVELTDGDDVVLPSDYAGEVNVVANSEVEIPEGFMGTVNINGGDVKLPDGNDFTGIGSYKNGELIIEDGEMLIDRCVAFSGSGSYEEGTVTITKGRISNAIAFFEAIIEATGSKGVKYKDGNIIGSAKITERVGTTSKKTTLLTESNTVYNEHNEISSSDGKPTQVKYTTESKIEYDIELTGKGSLNLVKSFDYDRVEIDISKEVISELNVDGVSYKGLDSTSKGSPYIFTLSRHHENSHWVKIDPPKGIGHYEGVVIEGASRVKTFTPVSGGTGVMVKTKRNTLQNTPDSKNTPPNINIETPDLTVNINNEKSIITKDPLSGGNDVIILADNSDVYNKYRIKPPSENPKKPYIDPMKKLKQDMLREFIEQLKKYERQPNVFDDTIPT